MDTESSHIELVSDAILRDADQPNPRLEQSVIDEAARRFAGDIGAVDKLRTLLFHDGIPVDVSFYQRLYRVVKQLGFSDSAQEIAGHVGASALLTLNRSNREAILRSLPSVENLAFFMSLGALPTLIAKVPFAAGFLIPVFFDLRARIGNDLAQGGFWRSLEVWAASYPDEACCGLLIITQRQLDDDGIAIGAAILGSLRVAWERAATPLAQRDFEDELARHPDVSKRLVFHRSWINTGWIRGLSHDEFSQCLERMTIGTSEERGEAFNFLRCLLPHKHTLRQSIGQGVAWLAREANPSMPEHSKHWVVHTIHALGESFAADDVFLDSLLPVIAAVQPIGSQNQGTWREVEHLLVALLHRNRTQFERLLRRLLDSNPGGLSEQFCTHGRFEYLCSQMATHGAADSFADLFFSPVRHHRQFAFTLYDELPFDSFPGAMLGERTDDEVALALIEFRLHYLEPENTRRFLLALRERAEQGAKQLANLFREELLYQAKNLPGAVLDALKTCQSAGELIQGVVAEADAYFDNARKAHHSAINSMDIPGWRRALSMRNRRQSREIETKSDEMSVFQNLISTSYLIYGNDGFRNCQDGDIGDFAPMKTFSTEMEMPRLAMIDPEGTAIRTHAAIRLSDQLATAVANMKREPQ